MGVASASPQQPIDEDPDDFRPASSWRLVVDPDGDVDMAVIYESIGVGDKIPRHWHDVDEVIIIERGDATVHVGGADLDVSDGATVFVPAGTVHGTRNRGAAPVDLRAVFPTTTLRMDLVERNPQPGTEGRAPKASVYDARTGDFHQLGETELPVDYR